MAEPDKKVGINLVTSVDTEQVARALAELDNEEVLDFLTKLDEHMNSWDFTAAAATSFVRTTLRLTEDDSGLQPKELEACARVGEMVRQLRINPAIEANPVFFGTWSDPNAEPVHLSVDDLDLILEMAILGIEAKQKGVLDA